MTKSRSQGCHFATCVEGVGPNFDPLSEVARPGAHDGFLPIFSFTEEDYTAFEHLFPASVGASERDIQESSYCRPRFNE